jgi:hypothetical protein
MATPVLLVLTALRWVGAARMPRALAQAGFEVTLLTPPGSLAEKSGFVAKIAYLPEKTPDAWVHAFAATAKATGAAWSFLATTTLSACCSSWQRRHPKACSRRCSKSSRH